MACKQQDKILAFDTLFSNNHIQMLKLLLPFLDTPAQRLLAVFIKFLELSYTLEFCKNHTAAFFDQENRDTSDFSGLCNELLPFCTCQEKKQLEQLLTMFQSIKMYQEMSKTMDAMKEFMPDMTDLFQTMQAASVSDGGLFSANTFSETDPTNSASEESREHNENNSGSSLVNMLMNLMTPEQKEMFALFGGNDHAK